MTEYQTRSDFQVIRVFGCWILAGSWSGSNVKSEAKNLRKEIKKLYAWHKVELDNTLTQWDRHTTNFPRTTFWMLQNGHVLLDEGLREDLT